MAGSGAVEPAASVRSGTSVTVAVSLSAEVTSRTGADTSRRSPGTREGVPAIVPPSTFQRPQGPDTDTFCRALRIELPVLWTV